MGWFSDAWDSVKSTASSVGDAVGSAVVDFAKDPVGHIESAATAVKNFGEYVVENPGRALQMAGKGIVNGVGSTVGMVGDLGMMAYNHGIRHGLNALGTNLQKSDFSCTEWTTNRIYDIPGIRKLENIQPENDYERAILYGTQGIVEVGAFIGVSVATAGVGGAAWGAGAAAIRGGSIAARSASWAGKTARVLSPFASRTAFITEAGVAGYSIANNFNEGAERAEAANQLAVTGLVESGQQQVAELDAAIAAELQSLGIDPNNVTIEALQNAGVDTSGMTADELRAVGVDPATGNSLSLRQESQTAFSGERETPSQRSVSSDLTRSDNAGFLSRDFGNNADQSDGAGQRTNEPVIPASTMELNR